jgi:hypothetical protein
MSWLHLDPRQISLKVQYDQVSSWTGSNHVTESLLCNDRELALGKLSQVGTVVNHGISNDTETSINFRHTLASKATGPLGLACTCAFEYPLPQLHDPCHAKSYLEYLQAYIRALLVTQMATWVFKLM